MKPTGKLLIAKLKYLANKVISFGFSHNENFLPPPDDFQDVSFNYSFSNLVSREDRIIKIMLEIELTAKSMSTGKEVKGSIATDNVFEIENLEELIEVNGVEIDLDPVLAATLSGLAFSTARGCIVSKFGCTPFEHFVLPIVNPTEFGAHQKGK